MRRVDNGVRGIVRDCPDIAATNASLPVAVVSVWGWQYYVMWYPPLSVEDGPVRIGFIKADDEDGGL